MNVSPNFTLAVLTDSQTATRHGMTEQFAPSPEVVANLQHHALKILEPLRAALQKKGKQLVITSGYRCERVNAKIGGAKNSQHIKGQATDIQVSGMKNEDLILLIVALKLPFDQLIEEFGSWVHVSSASSPRQQILSARKVNGKTVYEEFI